MWKIRRSCIGSVSAGNMDTGAIPSRPTLTQLGFAASRPVAGAPPCGRAFGWSIRVGRPKPPGAHVILRAEMNLLAAISTCPDMAAGGNTGATLALLEAE